MPKGLDENIKIAKEGGKIANITRENLENAIGKSVVSQNNNLIENNIKEISVGGKYE